MYTKVVGSDNSIRSSKKIFFFSPKRPIKLGLDFGTIFNTKRNINLMIIIGTDSNNEKKKVTS